MTVAALASSKDYIEDGITLSFAVPFRFEPGVLGATRALADGRVVMLRAGIDFTTSGGDTDAGGKIVLAGSVAGARLRVRRHTVRARSASAALDRFPAESHEAALDRAMLIDQEQDDAIADTAARALLAPDGELGAVLPAAAARAGKYLAGAAGGGIVAASGTGNDAALRADLAQPTGPALIGFQKNLANSIPGSLDARFQAFLFLKDFKTAISGSDWTTAWLSAIAAAPSGSAILIPDDVAAITEAELTMPRDNVTVMSLLGKGVIKAADGTSFEYLLKAAGRAGVVFRNLIADANRAGRAAGQAHRFMGLGLIDAVDCEIDHVTAKNTLGFGGVPAVGLAIGGASLRTRLSSCTAIDCGTAALPSDGMFASGDQCLIVNPICTNCTDTGAVIESANNSGIVGGSAVNCGAAAAITNATATDKRGNFIRGFAGQDWNSTVTGGCQIAALGAGKLLDTDVDIILTAPTAGRGNGPAINVRRTGAGRVDGLRLRAQINGASTQGVVVDGDRVAIKNSAIRGHGDAGIHFLTGSSGVVKNSEVDGGAFGLVAEGTATVKSKGNDFAGQSSWGIYAYGTATIASRFDDVAAPGIGPVGKDAGATINLVGASVNGLAVNNATGAAPTGAMVNKFTVYDRGGNPLGFVPVYNM